MLVLVLPYKHMGRPSVMKSCVSPSWPWMNMEQEREGIPMFPPTRELLAGLGAEGQANSQSLAATEGSYTTG